MIIKNEKIAKVQDDDITSGMLLDIEKNFNSDDKVPVILGHYASMDGGNPAYGWISGVAAADDVLYSDIEMSEELAELIKAGKYANKSVGIYEDGKNGWRLHHLAILGASPPRIRGLGQIKLNDVDVGDVDIKLFSYINKEDEENEMDKEKVKEMEAKIDELSAKNKQYSEQLEKLRLMEKQHKIKNFTNQVETFAEKAKGKMPIEKVKKLTEYMDKNKEVFADNEKVVEMVKEFSDLVDSMPQMVETGENMQTNSDEAKPVDARKMCKDFV